MKRLSGYNRSPEVQQFISAVLDLCERYGFMIEHEDKGGAFEIHRGDDHSWFNEAVEVME